MKLPLQPKIICLLSLFLTNASFATCLFKMGYSESGFPPLIAESPDNHGAFLDIFSLATKKIGCTLEVVRLPNKELHRQLKSGHIDFHPGLTFDKEYDPYLNFIPNSFSSGEYGITNPAFPDILSYTDLKNSNLTWYMETNSPKSALASSLGVRTLKIDDISIELLSGLAKENDAFFYVARKGSIQNYLYQHQLKGLDAIGLKIHRHCCGGEKMMYLAFSKYSPHFRPILNSNFNKKMALSPNNTSVHVSKDCMAYKLSHALKLIQKAGLSDRIYSKYFQKSL